MTYFVYILCAISMVLQALVVYYGIKLTRFVGHIKYWSAAWTLFIVSQVLIFIRRGLGIYLIFSEKDIGTSFLVSRSFPYLSITIYEIFLTIAVSVFLLLCLYLLTHLFTKYLHPFDGDEVLLRREATVEHRENTALKREDVVGKREVAVQEREDKQKQSSYYSSKKSYFRKIFMDKDK